MPRDKPPQPSTARWAKGAELGPLDGVPVTIKDNIATKGVPTPVGTAAAEMIPAAADAPPAARLREAGAVILGKTTMPDYGMLSSGLSSLHPLTRNPWNLDLSPGGSSAGAAAAGGGRLWPDPYRHRYRRLDPPAGRLVRIGRPQAQSRPRADRSVLCRPCRRAADPNRRRCSARHVGSIAARLARRHEPATRDDRLEYAPGRCCAGCASA